MILDKLSNCERYEKNEMWKKAFTFLKELNADSEEVKSEISGRDLHAAVMSYMSKKYEDGVIEAHQNYIDIHYVISGREKMYISDVVNCKVEKEYNPEKDVKFYDKDKSPETEVILNAGDFCVVFTNEAHSPQLSAGNEAEKVKKSVIKMAVNVA